jgi:hypothetical protein
MFIPVIKAANHIPENTYLNVGQELLPSGFIAKNSYQCYQFSKSLKLQRMLVIMYTLIHKSKYNLTILPYLPINSVS